MDKHLTEKDISEGEVIYEMFVSLPEDERKQARVYISALRDRAMMVGDKKAG